MLSLYYYKNSRGHNTINVLDDINPSYNDYHKDNKSKEKKVSLVNL